MEFQRSPAPTDWDICSAIDSIFISERGHISSISADKTVIGEKLPDINSKKIVPVNEEEKMEIEIHCSPDDQLNWHNRNSLAGTTGTNRDSIIIEEISSTNQVETSVTEGWIRNQYIRSGRDADLQILHVPISKAVSSANNKEVKHLEEINEQWRRKREYLIKEKSINLTPLAKMAEKPENNQLDTVKNENMDLKGLSMPKAKETSSANTGNETTKRSEEIYKLKKYGCRKKYKKISGEKLFEKMKNALKSENKEIRSSDVSSSKIEIYSGNILVDANCRSNLSFSQIQKYERCWRNRNKLMREETSKYPSLTKMIKIRNGNRLQCRANVGSGGTSNENEISSPSTSSDLSHTFNVAADDFNNTLVKLNENSFPSILMTNSEERRIIFFKENYVLQSRNEKDSEDFQQ